MRKKVDLFLDRSSILFQKPDEVPDRPNCLRCSEVADAAMQVQAELVGQHIL